LTAGPGPATSAPPARDPSTPRSGRHGAGVIAQLQIQRPTGVPGPGGQQVRKPGSTCTPLVRCLPPARRPLMPQVEQRLCKSVVRTACPALPGRVQRQETLSHVPPDRRAISATTRWWLCARPSAVQVCVTSGMSAGGWPVDPRASLAARSAAVVPGCAGALCQRVCIATGQDHLAVRLLPRSSALDT
jgi:hypothetical protein